MAWILRLRSVVWESYSRNPAWGGTHAAHEDGEGNASFWRTAANSLRPLFSSSFLIQSRAPGTDSSGVGVVVDPVRLRWCVSVDGWKVLYKFTELPSGAHTCVFFVWQWPRPPAASSMPMFRFAFLQEKAYVSAPPHTLIYSKSVCVKP